MDFLSNEMFVKEMSCGTDFAYILTDQVLLAETEYKVLQNQKDGFFIRCVKTKFNGCNQLYYSVKNYRTLAALAVRLDTVSFYSIVGNLLSNVVEMQNNGFLTCKNVLLDPNKIYVDIGTHNVYFVYVPTNRHIYQDDAEFESILRTKIIQMISDFNIHMTVEIKELYENLMDSTMPISQIYGRMSGVTSVEESDHNRVVVPEKSRPKRMRLIAVNHAGADILVDKSPFLIGKKADGIDFRIDNPTVSRRHCVIERKDDRFTVKDVSSNGSYLNGRRMPPEIPQFVENGDVLRLTQPEYRIVIE